MVIETRPSRFTADRVSRREVGRGGRRAPCIPGGFPFAVVTRLDHCEDSPGRPCTSSSVSGSFVSPATGAVSRSIDHAFSAGYIRPVTSIHPLNRHGYRVA